MFLFDLGNDRLWSWYPPCKSSLSIQWKRWRWGGRELTWNICILKGADPVVQVVAFHEDSVVVFKPSAVLLSVFVCDCLEFNSFGCTLFKANWSVSCQLWLLNTMFIHSFIHFGHGRLHWNGGQLHTLHCNVITKYDAIDIADPSSMQDVCQVWTLQSTWLTIESLWLMGQGHHRVPVAQW